MWNDSFVLNEIDVYGYQPIDKIDCAEVEFYYWDFEATEVLEDNCPSITPVHGIMYRGWVRDWINDQLWDEHVIFIRAIRNICLSPFYILIVAISALFCAYVFVFGIEM